MNSKKSIDSKEYSKKIKYLGLKLIRIIVKNILVLFLVLKDKDTPFLDKIFILAALVYFILPAFIEMFVPFIILFILFKSLFVLYKSLKDEHKELAKELSDNFMVDKNN